MPLLTGIDLTDEYIAVFSEGDEEARVFPACLCRAREADTWYLGEDALRETLSGNAVMAEKILRLLRRGGTQRIGDRTYTGGELLTELFRLLVPAEAMEPGGFLSVCLHAPDRELMDQVTDSLFSAGAKREQFLVTSHEEAFIYYVLSRDRELWSRMTCLFDVHDGILSYYEFLLARGVSPQAALCSGDDCEAFHPDILKNEAGRTLADRIVTEIAKRSMDGKLFSGVFLTGEGFRDTSWATGFLSAVCTRRKVMQENGLFAIGAEVLAKTGANGLPYVLFCDQRTASEVAIEAEVSGKKTKLILFGAGERWYGQTVHAELLLRGEDSVDFLITPFDRGKEKRVVRALLEDFPKWTGEVRRVALDLTFASGKKCTVRITDLGFGDLFPASGKSMTEEMEI